MAFSMSMFLLSPAGRQQIILRYRILATTLRAVQVSSIESESRHLWRVRSVKITYGGTLCSVRPARRTAGLLVWHSSSTVLSSSSVLHHLCIEHDTLLDHNATKRRAPEITGTGRDAGHSGSCLAAMVARRLHRHIHPTATRHFVPLR